MLLKMKYLIASFPYAFTQMKQQCLFWFSALSEAVLAQGFRTVDILLGKYAVRMLIHEETEVYFSSVTHCAQPGVSVTEV